MASNGHDQSSETEVLGKVDAWENVITKLGRSGRDKRLGTRITPPAPNTDRTKFEDLYHGDDLFATIAELPAKEMVREWITLNVDDSAPEDDASRTEETSTQDKMIVSKQMMQTLDEIGAQKALFKAMTWGRVFGGGLIFLGADDGAGLDPERLAEPLNEDAIRTFNFLTVFDRWEVEIHSEYDNPGHPKFGQPEFYRIQANMSTRGGYRQVDHHPIHESRFLRFDGVMTNRRRMLDNDGWSDSIYTRLESLLQDYGIAWTGIAHLLQDFAQAIFKIRGLKDALASDKDNLIIERLATLDLCRSIARAVPLDAEGEEFERKATPVTGLPELMDRFASRVSAAARIPVTLLFGVSPGGLNATGDSDIRLFYDNVKAMQENILRPELETLIRLLFKTADGPTRGKEPENWSFEFNPLWQMNDREQAELRKLTAETDAIYIQNGVLSEEEVAFSRFGGDAFSTETVLDTEAREQEQEQANQPEPEMPAAFLAQQNAPFGQVAIEEPVELIEQEDRADKIEKRGEKYVVLSEDGTKVLGSHDTREAAVRQLQAIETAKAADER